MYYNNNYFYPYFGQFRSDNNAGLGQMMYVNGKSYYISDCQDGDVTGDRVPDSVCVVGNRPEDLQSPFFEDITVMIRNGATGQYSTIPLKENVGYDPTVFLADFTGDKIKDIFVSIASGGSGGFSYDYVYSFVNSNAKLLFDSEAFSGLYKYQVNYRDNYKVEVISDADKRQYILDISGKGSEYLNEIYNPNGTLKAPLKGDVIPMGNVYPVDYERDKLYDLLMIQRIIGQYNADTLGLVNTVLKWNGKRFVLDRQDVSIFGNDLTDR